LKLPKQNNQKYFMGKICSFSGEYYRDYKKKKIGSNPTRFGSGFENTETIPVKWSIQKHIQQTGWIVGFGFCFNGTIEKEGSGDFAFKYFRAKKRVNYVRVRVTPMGKELKIPLSCIKIVKGE